MVSQSKILTVSYGTFSCTLEGFDDPFNTMKAIAEYFRDLAADDRYFGAEPPTPDAAMLHKIAEREIQRRVEAKVQDNGVILTAGSGARPAPAYLPQGPASTPQAADAVAEMQPATPSVQTPAAAAAAAQRQAPRAASDAGAIEDSVAAKLARIRAAVDRSRPAAAAAQIEDAEEVVAETLASPVPQIVSVAAAEPVAAAPEPEEPAMADIAAPQDPSVLAGLPEDMWEPDAAAAEIPAGPAAPQDAEHVDAAAEAAPEQPEVAAETVESKVSETDAPEPEAAEAEAETLQADTAEDDAAEADEQAVAQMAVAAEANEPAKAGEQSGPAPEMYQTEEPAGETDPEAAQAGTGEPVRQSASDVVTAAVGIDEDYDITALLDTIRGGTAEQSAGPALDAPRAADLPEIVEDADLDALLSSLAADEPAAPAMADPAETSEAAEPEAETTRSVPEAETLPEDEQPRPVRARVIKVRRIARPADAEATPETLDAEPATGSAAVATLSPEAEDELARELAEVEREMASDGSAIATGGPSGEQRPAADRLRRSASMRDLGEDEGEEAVSRLLRQTNSEMEVPETRRRAATIAHLKAAVAATVADRLPGKSRDVQDAERIEPYRDDLAQAVRPRRPESTTPGEGQRRPAALAGRIAPLVLVSEQRIDRPASDPSPVRPRRVTAAAISNAAIADEDMDGEDANIFRPDTRFDAFVNRLGATELPDLIEAAAAYVTVIDGRDSFTRPALMRLISGFKGEEISREEALRSFGALLRDGRIVKAQRGQFTTAEGARLVIEARKLAG